jgi:hypothetical protein
MNKQTNRYKHKPAQVRHEVSAGEAQSDRRDKRIRAHSNAQGGKCVCVQGVYAEGLRLQFKDQKREHSTQENFRSVIPSTMYIGDGLADVLHRHLPHFPFCALVEEFNTFFVSALEFY